MSKELLVLEHYWNFSNINRKFVYCLEKKIKTYFAPNYSLILFN